MFKFRFILIYPLLLLLFVPIISCKKSLEDDKKFAEEALIEKYLTLKKLGYTKVNGVYHVVVDTSAQAIIEKGNMVSFWYKGYNLSGKVFDTNIKAVALSAKLDTAVRTMNPIRIEVGKGKLIKGLDLGMLQLKKGEKAILLFPSTLGYGDNSLGPLDPWTSLIFDIQVIDVE